MANYLEREKDVKTAEEKLAEYLKEGGNFASRLRDEIKAKYEYNKDLINAKNVAASKYFAAPATAREKYADIFNPYSRENLVSQYRAQERIPWANLQDLLKERGQSIEGMVGRGVEGFQAETQAAENNLRAAQDAYNRALQQYQMQMAMRSGGGSGRRGSGGGGTSYEDELAAARSEATIRFISNIEKMVADPREGNPYYGKPRAAIQSMAGQIGYYDKAYGGGLMEDIVSGVMRKYPRKKETESAKIKRLKDISRFTMPSH